MNRYIYFYDEIHISLKHSGYFTGSIFPKRKGHYLQFPWEVPLDDFACIPFSLFCEVVRFLEGSLFFEIVLLLCLVLPSSFMAFNF